MNKRKFEAQIDEFGYDDGGVASFVFEVQSLKKGKVYEEHHAWENRKEVPSGYVIDDNSCWWQIGSSSFKERFKEVIQPLTIVK